MTQGVELPNEEVVANPRGLSIHVDMTDQRGAELSRNAGVLNEPSHLLWSLAVGLFEWDAVIDVGANYGEMLANVDLSRVRRIVAFEPNAEITPYLRKTLNALPWKVQLEEQAVSSSVAEAAELAVTHAWSGKTTLGKNISVLDDEEYDVVSGITVTTLDEHFADEPLRSACIKVDVEGEELGVLAGARQLFTDLDVAVCMVEILHMSVQDISRLAHRYPLFFLHVDDRRPVRVFGNDVNALGRLLHDGEHSRQDALIIAGRDRDQMATKIRKEFPEPTQPRRAVYTALMGDYERLQEQPIAAESDVDFICFTDNPSLTSQTWQIRVVPPAYPLDIVRSARHLKIVGHEALCGFSETLWVDNRVQLLVDPARILEELLSDCDIALFQHSFRDRLVDEFDAVVAGGYDDFNRVYEQLFHYAETAAEVLDEKPLWTGFLARRSNENVDGAMQRWLHHVLRYSRRDQLSINYAMRDERLRIKRLPGSNRESKYHRWPPLHDSLGRKQGTGRRFEHSVRTPLARLRAVEREHVDTIEAQRLSAAKREEMIRAQAKTIKGLEAQVKSAVEGHAKKQAARIADLERRLQTEEGHVAKMRERHAAAQRRIERQSARLARQSARIKHLRGRLRKASQATERKAQSKARLMTPRRVARRVLRGVPSVRRGDRAAGAGRTK